MFQKTEEQLKSPSMSQMFNFFKKDNKNINEKIYSTKTVSKNQLNNLNNKMNNNKYNSNTMSQSNLSYMTSPQVLDYSIINDEIKKRRTKGVFDVTSHRNKDIFIETDSEQYNSRQNSLEYNKRNKNKNKKNCSKLIVDTIDTLTSLIPGVIPTNNNNDNASNTYNANNNAIIPDNRQYSVKTYNNKNNFTINDIEDLKNLNINDGFEYEKCEKIKITITPNNNNTNINNQSYNTYYSTYKNKTNTNSTKNNNRIEEKRILLTKIKTKNNINNFDNIIDKERDLDKQRRTNNISYSNSEMKYRKYPFVI